MRLRSDNVGALTIFAAPKGSGDGMSLAAMEYALDIGSGVYEPVVIEHLPGVANVTADSLSRKTDPSYAASLGFAGFSEVCKRRSGPREAPELVEIVVRICPRLAKNWMVGGALLLCHVTYDLVCCCSLTWFGCLVVVVPRGAANIIAAGLFVVGFRLSFFGAGKVLDLTREVVSYSRSSHPRSLGLDNQICVQFRLPE